MLPDSGYFILGRRETIVDMRQYLPEGMPNATVRETCIQEFTAGRVCARKALTLLGVENFPLLSGPDRVPVWPKNIVGSISHCQNSCVVAATANDNIAGLGVDVEEKGGLEDSVKELICTTKEQQWSYHTMNPWGTSWEKIIFSAKESVYKCLYPLMRIRLDFRDAEVMFDEKTNTFEVDLFSKEAAEYVKKHLLIGRYCCSDSHIFTGVELRRKN